MFFPSIRVQKLISDNQTKDYVLVFDMLLHLSNYNISSNFHKSKENIHIQKYLFIFCLQRLWFWVDTHRVQQRHI